MNTNNLSEEKLGHIIRTNVLMVLFQVFAFATGVCFGMGLGLSELVMLKMAFFFMVIAVGALIFLLPEVSTKDATQEPAVQTPPNPAAQDTPAEVQNVAAAADTQKTE